MKIAVASIVYKETPPRGYGGIERVVYTQVEELVRQGHEVTLFATPGSYCSGATIEVPGYDPSKAPSGVRSRADIISEEPLCKAMEEYLERHPVDVIHDWSFQNLFVLRHPEKFPFVISTCIPPAPDYRRPNLVACSAAHAAQCGGTTKYVHYGLELDKYAYKFEKQDHFIHISKIARYKGQHLAILAFRKTREKLVIAGNVEDKFYYYSMIRPLLWISPNVSYIGEIQGTNRYLCDATALVQTPRWFDAFPLVILEAYASGTPVIAFAEGGIPEQVVDGVNGYLCRSVGDLVSAVERVREIKPRDCRAYAEEHYSSARMVRDYLELYHRAMSGEAW
jgi:glycosyltransferase involved in cell wall biosynthesis